MKSLATFFFILVLSAFAKAQENDTTSTNYSITITVENARTDDGKLLISLNTKDQFMKAAPMQSTTSTLENGVATITFNDVPAGAYAVMVLHDLNGNMQMDFEASGMPKESWGLSNNPAAFGPPTWDDARFVVDDDTQLTIKL